MLNENEKLLLASILVEPKRFYQTFQKVKPEHLETPDYRRYYAAMGRIAHNGEPDVNSVIGELESSGEIQKGDRTKLIELTSLVISGKNANRYADAIFDSYRMKELKRLGKALTKLNSEDPYAEAVRLLMGLANLNESRTLTSKDLTESYYASLDAPRVEGVPTGYKALDDILNNLRPATMNVLAARPAVGKTALALCMALHAAKLGKKTAVFSLEMSHEEVGRRWISMLSGMSMQEIEREPDNETVSKAFGEFAELPLWVNDDPSVSPEDCMMECLQRKTTDGLDFVIIDYLQLMEIKGKSESRLQEVSKITRSIKNMSKELNIPILALSQLSRSAAEGKPKMYHLRESGTIEQDSNVVMLLDRPGADPDKRDELPVDMWGKSSLVVSKHRSGPTGRVDLDFDFNTASFREAWRK